MHHTVHTKTFQGPIEVLYEMIEQRKLSVTDVSLMTITENFIQYTKNLQTGNFSKKEVSQFISIAAILILLKSKTLIPELTLTEEENRDILILENQLKAFELIKKQMKVVNQNWQNIHKIYLTTYIPHKQTETFFVPDPKMQIEYFHTYITERLSEILPKIEENKEVKVYKNLKIEDALSHIRQVIKRLKNLNFKNLNEEGDERLREKNKRTLVILFLAVLELVKIGEIEVKQEDHFGDILIKESY